MSESLKDTIVPKSDQTNADDLLCGPITVTVESVKRGDDQQPVSIGISGGYKPYKPCKSMRRVLISAWGDKGADWVGKSMTLYCDPTVYFGKVMVGGIRISHLSHIEADREFMLTKGRGSKGGFLVKRLVLDADPVPAIIAAFDAITSANVEADFLAIRQRCAGLSKAQLAKVKTAAEAAKVRMTPVAAQEQPDQVI